MLWKLANAKLCTYKNKKTWTYLWYDGRDDSPATLYCTARCLCFNVRGERNKYVHTASVLSVCSFPCKHVRQDFPPLKNSLRLTWYNSRWIQDINDIRERHWRRFDISFHCSRNLKIIQSNYMSMKRSMKYKYSYYLQYPRHYSIDPSSITAIMSIQLAC